LPFKKEFNSSLQGIDLTKPYILISGNSLVVNDIRKATESYTKLVNYLKANLNVQIILLEVCKGDGFLHNVAKNTNTPCIPVEIPILYGLNILANAKLYLSGRFHPSIMASLGATPCVFQGSNSHKTESLQQMLGYKSCKTYSAFPTEEEFSSILNEITYKINNDELTKELEIVVNDLSKNAHKLTDVIR
jgi:polysaccharide pyruvyl transferase WcaK-like protein